MAVRANASGDHLKRQTSIGITAPPWTVLAWVNRRGAGASFGGVVTLSDANTTDGTYCTSDEGGVGTPRFVGFNGSAAITDSNMTTNQWRGQCCQIENATNGAKFYRMVTGAGSLTLVGQNTPNATQLADASNLKEIWIGDSRFGGEWWNGSWCCVRGWNAILNTTEILAEFNSATPVRITNLQFSYRLATNSDLSDGSGNGRTLVANGTIDTDTDEPSEIAAAGVNITPAVVSGVVSIPTPTISVGSVVSPATVVGALTVPAFVVGAGSGVSPVTIQGVADIPAPVVSAQGNINVTPPTVEGVASIPAPSMSMGAVVSPPTVQALIDITTPVLFTDVSVNIFLETIQAVISIPSPTVISDIVNRWNMHGEMSIETIWTRSEDDSA